MSKYVMIVQSRAVAGQEDAYSAWYDTVHLADILSLSSVKSGRRFELATAPMGTPGLANLSIFEVETDDPNSVLAEMSARSADGRMAQSDTLDAPATVMWFYRQRDTARSDEA